MSLLEIICKELGVKIGEEWLGNDGFRYKIHNDGSLSYYEEEWEIWNTYDYRYLLTGELKPVWKPKINETYYYPAIHLKELYVFTKWHNDIQDLYMLEKGFVFKNKQDAIDKAKEILDLIEE